MWRRGLEHVVGRMRTLAAEVTVGEFDLEELRDAVAARRPVRLGALRVALPSVPVAVVGDREVVALALHGLVDNAWEAGAAQVEVAWEVADGWVTVRVHDDGAGVPEPVRARLFEAGATAGKPGAAGLGLFFARRACQAYGGDVRLEATGPRGTTVAVVLPRVAAVVDVSAAIG